MFGNLSDKFFCLLLGVFAVFILVLKNSNDGYVENFVNVPMKPSVEKVMKTKCNGQVVEVAVPADYAAQAQANDARREVVEATRQGIQQAATKAVATRDALEEGDVERYGGNRMANFNQARRESYEHYRENGDILDKLGDRRRRRENYRENADVDPLDAAKGRRRRRENYEHAGQPNREQGFHTVPGQLESTLAPRQFLGATQASKAVTNNFPADEHLTGRTHISDDNVIEPLEGYVERADDLEQESEQQGPDLQPVVYDRLVFKPAKSRKAGQGDMIRGDLPIVPCPQISQPAANPVSDLQNGALNVLFGQPQDILAEVQTAELATAVSGQQQFTGEAMQQGAGGGIAVVGSV